MKSIKMNVVFKSAPVELRVNPVILDVSGAQQEILNDFV